jgi:hypothetical protein
MTGSQAENPIAVPEKPNKPQEVPEVDEVGISRSVRIIARVPSKEASPGAF